MISVRTVKNAIRKRIMRKEISPRRISKVDRFYLLLNFLIKKSFNFLIVEIFVNNVDEKKLYDYTEVI